MTDLLKRCSIGGFDAQTYISDHRNNATALPNVAIAVSGGGYRALLNGGGALQAFDGREDNSTAAGHLGGLLQSATYLAGLSGGGWLVGSIFVNNFTTITGLKSGPTWQFGNSILEGPDSSKIQAVSTAKYFETLGDEVDNKKDAGFSTSITDYWGRALSYQLVNASDGGPAYTWSSIQLQDSFVNAQSPFPILVSDSRYPGEKLISSNTTIYEFNPFELGTNDPSDFGFVPLEYLGSNFSGGKLVEGADCVRGFDNVGYIMGTSSSLFNQFLLQVNQSSLPEVAKTFLNKALGGLDASNSDIADYTPNPFYGYRNNTSRNTQSRSLHLVDGGENNENIPLQPLIQPNRHVDVIFAVDSSADTDKFWPNGSSLVASYERSLSDIANGTSFPAVPDTNSFINLGLNIRPSFFGCNSSNTSSITPLIVYIPNSPYVYQSNFSTFTMSYNTSERDAMLSNGYEVATMGNGTVDPTWPACVGCAIVSRSLERTGTTVPDTCTQCFQKYCWDGRTNSTPPASYEPPYQLTPILGAKKQSAAGRSLSCHTGLVMAIMVLAGLFVMV